jgi:hypothetical protein
VRSAPWALHGLTRHAHHQQQTQQPAAAARLSSRRGTFCARRVTPPQDCCGRLEPMTNGTAWAKRGRAAATGCSWLCCPSPPLLPRLSCCQRHAGCCPCAPFRAWKPELKQLRALPRVPGSVMENEWLLASLVLMQFNRRRGCPPAVRRAPRRPRAKQSQACQLEAGACRRRRARATPDSGLGA